MSKIRASHHASMRIMHIATENMWFLRKLRKALILKALGERADSILYLTLDVSSAALRRP